MSNLPESYNARVKAIELLINDPARPEVQTALATWWDRPHSKRLLELDEVDFAAFHLLIQNNGYITPREYEVVARRIVMAPEDIEVEAMQRLSTTMLRDLLRAVVKNLHPNTNVEYVQANMKALPILSFAD